jgi:hypothetical protein
MCFKNGCAAWQREVKQALLEGSQCPCAKTAATCFELLKVEEGLWRFARRGSNLNLLSDCSGVGDNEPGNGVTPG